MRKKRSVKAASDSVDLSNLTGGQIQSVLDHLVFKALRPIVIYSNAFDVQLAYLLSIASRNRKRKLSALPREVFISMLTKALATKDREEKLALISEAKIERGFIYNFVVEFLKAATHYKDIYCKHVLAPEDPALNLKLKVVEKLLDTNRAHLYSVITTSNEFLGIFYEFRNRIVINYIKHSHKQAHAFVKMKGDNFDVHDVSQNFLTAVTKAMDKYDCSKGALTSYINFWLLSAQNAGRSGHDHEYGIAFSVPQVQRKALAQGTSGDMNYAVSLESMLTNEEEGEEFGAHAFLVGDQGVEKRLEREEQRYTTSYLIKAADTKGLARLYLDLDECFSRKEMNQMRATMEAQGTA